MLACLKWNLPPSHLSQSPPITVSLSEGTVDSNLVGTEVTRSGARLTPERWRRAWSSFFGFGRASVHCCTGSTGGFRQMEWSPGPKPEPAQPLDSDFVRQLKAKMAAEGWNQTELAAHARVDRGSLNKWLRGQQQCRIEAEVLRQLGLPPLESAESLDSDFVWPSSTPRCSPEQAAAPPAPRSACRADRASVPARRCQCLPAYLPPELKLLCALSPSCPLLLSTAVRSAAHRAGRPLNRLNRIVTSIDRL